METILEVKDLTKTFVTEGKADFTAIKHIQFPALSGRDPGNCRRIRKWEKYPGKSHYQAYRCHRRNDFSVWRRYYREERKKLRQVYKNIQMIFQNPVSSFDPRRSLGHGIGESLRNSGVPKEEAKKRVLELLGQCGLSEEFYDRYPHEVSGGQCQRAAIARALAVKPKIVICDEATSALDVTVQQQIMELLDAFRKEYQISYLFICHNLALVQQFCDRVLVMKDGRIVEEGTPDEVILKPKEEYTKMLVESVF